MIDTLQSLDQQWLLAVNGMHNGYLDAFMWEVSRVYSWALILVAVLVVNVRMGWRQTLCFVLAVAVAVLLADQVASSIIKPLVERLRPTHDPSLAGLVHVVRDYRGGMYGFVSSHSANAFAVAVLVGLMMPHRAAMGALLAWACLQCYSRMYLGVHYPGDIVGGMIVGVASAMAVYAAWRRYATRMLGESACAYSSRDSLTVAAAVGTSMVVIAVAALTGI